MKKILTTFLILASASIIAQVKTLTLKDAISYALENKADAKKSKLKVENSDYLISEAKSKALPQIGISGGLTNNAILQTTVVDAAAFGGPEGSKVQLALGQKWTSTAAIGLNQALFDQSVFIGLKAAKSTKEFYQINDQLTEEQLIEKVANAYYQVYITKQNLKNLESNFESTTKVKNIINGQYTNGLARKIDLDRVSVKLNNISSSKLQVKNAVELQENALKFFIGMPIETAINLPETEFEATPYALQSNNDVTSLTQYQALKKQEELLEYQKKAVKSSLYPSLSLSGNYGFLGQGSQVPWFVKPTTAYWSDYASIGLNLKVPVFTGFAVKSKIQQADISIKSIQEDLNDTKLALELQQRNAIKQIENSLTNINQQRENATLAQQVRDNTNNNYIQGLASLTDLLDSDNALIEAKNNYTSALLDYKLAEIQLIKSKGELKTLTK